MLAVQVLTYVSVATAVIAMALKAYRYATAPQSMRWELYPVPHEAGKAEYGGSYLEELDWWNKPRETDTVNELKEMAEEVLLLKGVYRHNRRVWMSSLPFHLGLYLCIGWLVLLLGGAVLEAFGVGLGPSAGVFGNIVHMLTVVLGYGGLGLSGLGALGLLLWRLSDNQQRPFNSPAEYFNLVFFIAVATIALFVHATVDPTFTALRSYVSSLLTFTPFASPSPLFTAELILIAALIMYIPLTRMSHFVAKYFLYHAVRWNDNPNERGSKMEEQLVTQLSGRVDWKGPHIQTGQTWADVVKELKDE